MQKQSIAVNINNYDGSAIDITEMGQVSSTNKFSSRQSIKILLCILFRTDSSHRSTKLTLPVYLNSTRAELLFTVDLAVAPGQDPHSFYERGVAVLTSTALN